MELFYQGGPLLGRDAPVQIEGRHAKLLLDIFLEQFGHFRELAKDEQPVAFGQDFFQKAGQAVEFSGTAVVGQGIIRFCFMQILGRMVAQLLQLHQHAQHQPLASNAALFLFLNLGQGVGHHRLVESGLLL